MHFIGQVDASICMVLVMFYYKTTGDFLSLFNEVNIFSKYTNLIYGPLKSKNTYQTKLYSKTSRTTFIT